MGDSQQPVADTIEQQWGEDEDVTARLAGLAHEIRNAARFLRLIDP